MHAGSDWLVFDLDPAHVKLELLGQLPGEPRTFEALKPYLEARGERLILATNAGIFAEDRRPVGLLIERSQALHPLSTENGEGNFYLKPNGVFWLDDAGPHVAPTGHYSPHGAVSLATQSGPLLLDQGHVHPAFTSPGTSLKVRSGVGVDTRGHVRVVLSRSPVSFIDMATLFRDALSCADALYLDGEISGVLTAQSLEGRAGHTYAALLVATERVETKH